MDDPRGGMRARTAERTAAKDIWVCTRDVQIGEPIDRLLNKNAVVIVSHAMRQAARISRKTAFSRMGKADEYGDTVGIVTNPVDTRTDIHITGRIS